METEDDFLEENNNNPEVEIYSKRAIWWFSIFSPLFGAILLMINMWNAGYKRDIVKIIFFLIAWMILSNVLVIYVPVNAIIIAVALTIAAAAILAEYFFVQYFPEKDYYPRSIDVPLFILLIITVPPVVYTMIKMNIFK